MSLTLLPLPVRLSSPVYDTLPTREAASLPKSTGDELRCASRFRLEPKSAFAMLHWPDGHAQRVEVYDESLFGICLVMGSAENLEIGCEIELNYVATALHGTVRNVTSVDGGVFLVGLSTTPMKALHG